MDNIFVKEDNQELLDRLDKLSPKSKPLWGKMNVCQMVTHCQKPLEVAEGKLKLKRGLLGLLFGKLAKNNFLKNGFKKNMQTIPAFKIDETLEFETEWTMLKNLVKSFGEKGPEIIAEKEHPIFGKMTEEEWGVLQYKHLDHHLKQFDV